VVSEDSDQKIPRHCASHKREIQARHENVVKEVVKFIEGEGKAKQEKALVGPGQVGQKGRILFQRAFIN
jgi:hypothetical protein